MTNYLEVDGLVFSETEMTKEQTDLFMDRYVELVESFGWLTATGFKRLTEEELSLEEAKYANAPSERTPL